MPSTSITLHLKPDLVEAFQKASPEKRKQIQHLVEDALRPLEDLGNEIRVERIITEAEAEKAAGLTREKAHCELMQTMNDMASYAAEQGLTEETLKQLLRDDD
jgi:hypothetical protein